MWFMPRSGSSSSSTVNPGVFYSVIDLDDAATLSGVTEALSYQSCMFAKGIDGHYRRWRPHCSVPEYAGGASGYKNIPASWSDIAYTNVEHYGVKTVWSTTDTAYVMDVLVRIHAEFRFVR